MMKMLAFIAAGAIVSAAAAQSSSSTQSATTAGSGQVGTTGASSSASRNTNWTNDNTKPDTAFSASTSVQDNVGTGDRSDATAQSRKKSKRHHHPR
jgi:hypothetical protein